MPLLNSFVESLVCVGFTPERGLKFDQEFGDHKSIFTCSLQPSLLAVVTADRAMYPQSLGSEFIDPSYPPVACTGMSSSMTLSMSSGRSSPQSSIAAGFRVQKQHMLPSAYKNLPLFCFPDGVRAINQQDREKIHQIVFTQEEGKRIYALALTYYQPFILKNNGQPDEDGIYQIEVVKTATFSPRRSSVSKIPVAVDRQRLATQSSPSSSSKPRSKKIPVAFHNQESNSTGYTRSTSVSSESSREPQLHHYETHTISSFLKNVSSNAQPPPTRMIRTSSQSSMSSFNDAPTNATLEVRKRSDSIRPRSSSVDNSSTTFAVTPDLPKPFFLPHCIVLVSNQPYWTSMQETISIIRDDTIRLKIDTNSTEYKQLIQKYAFLACNTPTPPIPIHRFSLSFSLSYDQSIIRFDPPIDMKRTVLDLDLSILLLTLNIGKLLDVLAVILTQRPIIFFSSNYSMLVTTLECLLYLIYPLKWVHVYVPFVPDGLRDYYLEGPPGSYIMGAHSRHQAIVEELNMSFTCNLDNDKNIHVPNSVEFHRIPPTKLQRFVSEITKCLESIKVARSLQNVHTPVRTRIDQQREYEQQQRSETNYQIMKIFLDLMIDVFGDALEPIYWKLNPQQLSPTNTLTRTTTKIGKDLSQNQTKAIFSKETYLLSKAEDDESDFYRDFIDSTAFQLLMEEERITESQTIFRQIYQLHSLSSESELYHVQNSTIEGDYDHQTEQMNALTEATTSQMLLPLPEWPSTMSEHYLDSCIEVFTNELKSAEAEHSSTVITIYAYLRGCAYLARGQYLEGLRDLYLIENPNLFPHDYIETVILPRLSDEGLLDSFLQETYYKEAPGWKQVHRHSISPQLSIIDLEKSGNSLDETTFQSNGDAVLNSERNITENNLNYEQFKEHVHRSSIVLDQDTSEKLFNALLYWTDSSKVDTLKATETSTTTLSKPTETGKLSTKNWSTANSLTDTFNKSSGLRRKSNQSSASQSPSSPVKPSTPSNITTLPTSLFESFLDVWQQTNAEKVRMNRCLPRERQNQESILKISSSGIVSKSDGPGQLILTQKRLYILPETGSTARLLTELRNISAIEKYQHQTIFSSSKPGMKISTSSSSSLPRGTVLTLKSKTSTLEKDLKSPIRLIFKDNYEQELWYVLIMELWSGITIAHEQCDTAALNKASRHIALMDALANIKYDVGLATHAGTLFRKSSEKPNQRHHKVNLEVVLNGLSTFTQLRQNGSFKSLSTETRNALIRRLSPSINEAERHAIRCLVITDNPDNLRKSLWCAYGTKLKIFDTTTWICDPVNIVFPSLITCMCLDSRSKLWVGCINGQLYIVDTLTRVCGTQLASMGGEGGCQSMEFYMLYNQVLVANRAGLVIVWSASNFECLFHFSLIEIYQKTYNTEPKTFKSEAVVRFRNTTRSTTALKSSNQKRGLFSSLREPTPISQPIDLPDVPSTNEPAVANPSPSDKLKCIQIYNNRLFACYQNDYVLIFRTSSSNSYTCEHAIAVTYKSGDSRPIDAFIVYNKQVWVSSGNIIDIFGVDDSSDEYLYKLLMRKPVENDRLTTMLGFSGHMWAGSLRGDVSVYRMDNYELLKNFAGHHDSVCCLCPMLDTYVLSGSAQNDTSIAIWEKAEVPRG